MTPTIWAISGEKAEKRDQCMNLNSVVEKDQLKKLTDFFQDVSIIIKCVPHKDIIVCYKSFG